MKLGIMADSHDRLENIKQAVKIFQEQKVAMIIHCGDWVSPFSLEFFDFACGKFRVPVKSVWGNNEGDINSIIRRNAKLTNPVEFAEKQTCELEIEGKKIAVYHGQDKVILKTLINSGLYDAVFTGHTHKVRNEIVGKTLVLNPGATCLAVESRIVNEASVAIYETETNEAEIIKFDSDR